MGALPALLALLLATPTAHAQGTDGGRPQLPAEALPRIELAPPREPPPSEVVTPEVVAPAQPDGGTPEAPGLAEEPTAGDHILQVRVTGNRRVEESAILAALSLAPGDILTPERAAEALRALFDLVQFSDVRLSREPAQGGVVLLVEVEERPLVADVRVEGADALPPEERQELVTLASGDVWRPELARSIAASLEERLVSKGYYQATVKVRTQAREDSRVDVHFDAVVGPRVRVDAVRFVGGEDILPEETLRDVALTTEANLLTFFTQLGYLRKDLLEHDSEALRAALQDRGYAQAQVKSEVSLSPDQRAAFVTFLLTPGAPFRFGQVALDGDPLPPGVDDSSLALTQGAPFRRSDVNTAVQGLTLALQDQGYAFADVQPIVDLHPEEGTADLTLRVETGPRADVQRIDITGNTHTRDAVIRRELLLVEGEPFSRTRLEQSVARLRALDLFAKVETRVERLPDGAARVVVEVEEKKTGEYRFGVGYASVDNAILTGRITERNLFGRGQAASAMAQYSSLRLVFEASFTEPYLLGVPVALTPTAYRSRYDYFSFVRTATGASAIAAYRFGGAGSSLERLVGTLGYVFERVDVGLAPEFAEEAAQLAFRDGRTSLVRLGLVWDSRDNPLLAARGLLAQASTEFAPRFLGGTLLLSRTIGYLRGAVPLPLNLALKGRLLVGYIAPLGGEPLPSSELFFSGGPGSVRGYVPRTLSPTAPVEVPTDTGTEVRQVAVGGNKEFAVGVELEFPLLPRLGVRGVAFWDAGNAFAFDEPFFEDRQNVLPLGLFQGAGAGLRWLSPLGLLRLEWGFALNRRPGDRLFVVEVGAGDF